MFCRACGKKIEKGELFCSNCRASVQEISRDAGVVRTGKFPAEDRPTGRKDIKLAECFAEGKYGDAKVLYVDESVPKYQNFISLCEQEGIHFVTEKEVDRLISRRRVDLGIKESWENGKGLYWNTYL